MNEKEITKMVAARALAIFMVYDTSLTPLQAVEKAENEIKEELLQDERCHALATEIKEH